MQNKILEINKEEFLDWRFDDEEDLIFLGTFTFYKLNNNDTISIDTIWKATRYIPINLVKNQNEIDFEDEINPKDFDVKWI